MIVEGHPAADADFRLRAGFPRMQADALVLQGPPQTLDKDTVDAAALAVHRYPGADAFHAVSPGERCKPVALVAVHDLARAEAVCGLIERLDTEPGFAGVRY